MQKKSKTISLFLSILAFCSGMHVFADWTVKLRGPQINVQHEINLARQRAGQIVHPSWRGAPFTYQIHAKMSPLDWAILFIKTANEQNKELVIRYFEKGFMGKNFDYYVTEEGQCTIV